MQSDNLRHELARARSHTDELFALLDPSSLYERPISERHRIIFYLGHLETFDWNQIAALHLGEKSFHPEFDRLFEAGIDPEPGKAPSDTPADWPAPGEVQAYKARIRSNMDRLWDEASPDVRQMVIEHRDMHAETFAYMLHNLSHEKKRAPKMEPVESTVQPKSEMLRIPAGTATLGKRKGEGFGWDNEFEQEVAAVPEFSIGKYKVTNGEYLEYVKAGASAPHFWTERDGEWFYKGMFEDIPLPLDWPVYVTQHEAAAYAHSKGKSLPTEAQFHRAAYGTPDGRELDSLSVGGNFDFAYWDPIPVNASPAGESSCGVAQLVGNGWEWTSTLFGPFDGFQPAPTYPGYSANFFDDRHYVVKGASPRTSARLTRRSFRNWFRPEYPYTYTTFRLVEN
ncbi:MAG: SUMF1/EgtB/PvdO family nonheme iron enzyme [Acidobacteriota bacterium]|nr:SUMF1/EgtB/PvdO family nonheme iron enzyme [Acidobacteriota bacterium]